MPRRPIVAVLALLVLLASGAGFANGWSIKLKVPVVTNLTDKLIPSNLGQDLYDAQEGVHALVTGLTGIAVPHDYIWIHLGEHAIPVDPINFSK